jgi:hypothetical protein
VPRLFSDSLKNTILLGLTERDVTLTAALHLAVLEDDVAEMPQGLETVVRPRGVRLSGGQVQRTAAARLFVRAPALLVFDDVSSALDGETEALLWGGSARAAPLCAWWSPIGRRRFGGRIRSSCSQTVGLRLQERSTSCSRRVGRCGTSGVVTQAPWGGATLRLDVIIPGGYQLRTIQPWV